MKFEKGDASTAKDRCSPFHGFRTADEANAIAQPEAYIPLWNHNVALTRQAHNQRITGKSYSSQRHTGDVGIANPQFDYVNVAVGTIHEKVENRRVSKRALHSHRSGKRRLNDLYTKALILARVVDGEEVEWKNLDRIWALVGNKKDFLGYVREELKRFLDPPGEQDG